MWRSSIWPITARFNTSWPESHSWSSRGQFRPFLISSSIQVRQNVCPHLMEMTGSMKTFLQTGHSKADGSSTNLVGLPGISFSWFTRFSFRAFSMRRKGLHLSAETSWAARSHQEMGAAFKWATPSSWVGAHYSEYTVAWYLLDHGLYMCGCTSVHGVCDREQLNICHGSHQWLSRVPKATLICLQKKS